MTLAMMVKMMKVCKLLLERNHEKMEMMTRIAEAILHTTYIAVQIRVEVS